MRVSLLAAVDWILTFLRFLAYLVCAVCLSCLSSLPFCVSL